MNYIELSLIAVGLAMDCFAVALSFSIYQKKTSQKTILLMALFFGLFQAGMPVLGWLLGGVFEEYIQVYDHWIAFSILSINGIKMIGGAIKKKEVDRYFDLSSIRILLALSIATSIDAFMVGLSFAFLEVNIFKAIFIIGNITFLLTLVGVKIGRTMSQYINSKWAEIFGGIVLLFLGLKILLDHLYYI
ncbi:MAG: manganese efflux pump MntP family protein [Bacteroidales bacterium]|nr:manganese efflux pump MntP family protein [Bacteroidales bacterium]